MFIVIPPSANRNKLELLFMFIRFLLLATLATAFAGDAPMKIYGPYNASFIPSGLGLNKPIKDAPNGAWTLYSWVYQTETQPGARPLIGGFGGRYLAVMDGHAAFQGGSVSVSSNAAVPPEAWHFLAASYDGTTLRLYVDGTEGASQAVSLPPTTATNLEMGPLGEDHFAGRLARFTLVSGAVSAADLKLLSVNPGNLDIIPFEAASKSWPVQTRAQAGLKAPQDPSTLPVSSVPPQKPVKNPNVPDLSSLKGWRLIEASKLKTAYGGDISVPGFPTPDWYRATVPGTVLQTLIDQGVYPDSDYGLNNLAIPESLAHQDYWYRTDFKAWAPGRRVTLTFNGINYAASASLLRRRP
jgi:hypothetical protein